MLYCGLARLSSLGEILFFKILNCCVKKLSQQRPCLIFNLICLKKKAITVSSNNVPATRCDVRSDSEHQRV